MSLKVTETAFVLSATAPVHYPPASVPEIAFVGRSNVGKSSLLNSLFGRTLARTSSTPGRTRLINFFTGSVGGVAAGWVDLPGYGYAKVSKSEKESWRSMIEGYLRDRSTLVGVVLLIDARRGAESDESEFMDWMESFEREVVVVATKLDKLGKAERFGAIARIQKVLDLTRPPIGFSAETGEGRDPLLKALRGILPSTSGRKEKPARADQGRDG